MTLSRRTFLSSSAASALATAAPPRRHVPIGLEMFSVREELKQDLMGTVRAVAAMGYEGVEFYAPYYEWTPAYAGQVRTLLDDLNVRCWSTHNAAGYFDADKLPHAIELNKIIGSEYIVMAHPGQVAGLDGWKAVTAKLAAAAETLRPLGLKAGFHNHPNEWRIVEGVRPIDVIAAGTPSDFALQLDTATCLAERADPVAFIRANPGRVKSYHMKDWSDDPQKGYRVLLGEGIGKWRDIVDAAETVGGVHYYLIEQEGSRFSPMETARLCLENLKRIRDAG